MELTEQLRQQTILAVIRASARVEREAQGPDRRRVFRNTRYLLAAAVALGVSRSLIAAELGVRAETVRTRAGLHGPISTTDFAELTGLPLARIHSWTLPSSPEDPASHTATHLLKALLHDTATHQPEATEPAPGG